MIELNSNFFFGVLIGGSIASLIWGCLYYKELKYQLACRLASQVYIEAELELTTRCYEGYKQDIFWCMRNEEIKSKVLPINSEIYTIEPDAEEEWRIVFKEQDITIYPPTISSLGFPRWHDNLSNRNGFIPLSALFRGKLSKHLPLTK
ncbi:MAG: hypothetical protein GJ671_00540 [Alteromonadaceae bacterium]|nr:hypothetical protein [Alteromonadaceae bacterium]